LELVDQPQLPVSTSSLTQQVIKYLTIHKDPKDQHYEMLSSCEITFTSVMPCEYHCLSGTLRRQFGAQVIHGAQARHGGG